MRLHATVVVIDEGKILLIQREDFKIWAQPGEQWQEIREEWPGDWLSPGTRFEKNE